MLWAEVGRRHAEGGFVRLEGGTLDLGIVRAAEPGMLFVERDLSPEEVEGIHARWQELDPW